MISDGGGEGYGEEVLRVGEGAGGSEAGVVEQRGDGGGGEFVTVFGMNGFAWGEVQGEGWGRGVGGDVDGLRGERFEVDLDAGLQGIPERAVEEAVGAEVGAQGAIEVGEDVSVEGGGDALGVVVGGEQGGDGLVGVGGQVDAEEQGVAGREFGAEAGEDLAGFVGGEVADAGADVEGENFGVGRALDADRVGDVVGDAGADGDAGDVAFDGFAGFVERGGADVDGLVEDVGLEAGESAEEDSGFGGRAGAELGDGEGRVTRYGLLVVSLLNTLRTRRCRRRGW